MASKINAHQPWSESLTRVWGEANVMAMAAGSPTVEPAHFALALASSQRLDPTISAMLFECGVSLEEFRLYIEAALPEKAPQLMRPGLPLPPRAVLSASANRLLVLAQRIRARDAARRLAPEHVLLALVEDYGAADGGHLLAIFQSLNLTPEALRKSLRVARAKQRDLPRDPLAPFETSCRAVVEEARRISRQSYCGLISPVHLALAVLRTPDPAVGGLLRAAGVDVIQLEAAVRRHVVSDHAVAAPGFHFDRQAKDILGRMELDHDGEELLIEIPRFLTKLLLTKKSNFRLADLIREQGVAVEPLIAVLKQFPPRHVRRSHLGDPAYSQLARRSLEGALINSLERGGRVLRSDLLSALLSQCDSLGTEVVRCCGGDPSLLSHWLLARPPEMVSRSIAGHREYGRASQSVDTVLGVAANIATYLRTASIGSEHVLLALLDYNLTLKPKNIQRGGMSVSEGWHEARASQLLGELEEKGVRIRLKETLGWERFVIPRA